MDVLSPSVLRIIVVVALAAHGIAHAIALSGLVGQSVGGPSASHVAVRSWLLPGLGPNAAAAAAVPFWLVATTGFLLAALSFSGVLVPDAPWRQIAVASAVASIAGIALSTGTWPGSPDELRSLLNTGIALTMNVAVLATQLWLHWPAEAMPGG
jgi:hypothetical protein